MVARQDDPVNAAASYVQAAIVHGKATETGDYKRGNRAHDEIMVALRVLREAGEAGRAELRKLLKHPNDSVRCWAATHLLKSDTWAAKWVLYRLAMKSTIVGFDARMVLREWRKGRLEIP